MRRRRMEGNVGSGLRNTDESPSSETDGRGGERSALDVAPQTCASCLKSIGRFLCWTVFYLLISLVVFLAVVAPAVIKIFPQISKHIVYLNAFKIPYNVNLSDPSSVQLDYARNFYHHVEDNITVGVWHVLPKSLEKPGLQPEEFESLLSAGPSIMLYCHGNTGTRGTDNRVIMYKLLSSQEFHIIALDYRGFGDSTGSPTSEDGVMSDVVSLYLMLREKAGPHIPIYVWGHSLGTGIATKAVRFLTEQKEEYPRALILESPFNNVFEAALEHPFSKVVRLLWWFDDVFLEAMHSYGIYLQNDEHICHIELPVLILHAEDDIVVPYALGVKLYEASKKRPDSFPPVVFHTFPKELGLLHKWICTATELPRIIEDFISSTEQVQK
ncbi:lysophosphatidylserine lipase ABHD12-like isoform X1 [Watersipora subatra]|uniref:lysophosphatidylserine lipase ABHD12-like isoform X1 n=1 Tax=Watersipora subatra TaxID=2589382 RepID=UPI00355B587A